MRIRLFAISIIMVVVLVLQFAGPVSFTLAYSYPLQPDDPEIEDALDFLRDSQQSDGSIDGFAVSSWVVMAIAAAGEDPNNWRTAAGNPSIIDYLRDNADNGNATDWERCILGITAAGEDPYDFGGINYVAELKEFYDGNQIGYEDTLNDDFWGILALISAGEDPDSSIIQDSASYIKNNQNEHGDWSWSVGGEGEADNTAAAIMALIAAGESPESEAIVDGLAFLSEMQNSDGGFPRTDSDESNSSSDSWSIGALLATAEDPTASSWTPAGSNPVGHLLSLQDPDGSFRWKERDSSMSKCWMTAYAIPALLGKTYPVAIYETSPDEIVIACSPSGFNFDAIEGADDPANRTLEIWNSGTGTLNWSISDDADWLSVSPSSGSSAGERDEVSISIDISGLDVDDYDGTITITAAGAENSPRYITINLEIEELSEEPVIGFSDSVFSFAAIKGGDAPQQQILKIWNKGADTLEWSVSSSADWLTLKPKSGRSGGEKDKVTISVNPGGMETGDYDAEIVIKGDSSENSPQRTTVSLHIVTELNYCKLFTTVSPLDGGSIGVDISQPVEGYLQGTELSLVAVPTGDHVFSCWTGDIDNTTNPIDITLSSDNSIVANFVLFNNTQLPGTELLMASPGINSISTEAYPVSALTGTPAGLDVSSACVVESTGNGSFRLRFNGISSGPGMRTYEVIGEQWVEAGDVVYTGSDVELTLDAGRSVIAFTYPSTTATQGFAANIDRATKLAIIIIVVLVLLIVFVIYKSRGETY